MLSSLVWDHAALHDGWPELNRPRDMAGLRRAGGFAAFLPELPAARRRSGLDKPIPAL
jgi:hypothetical protein